MYRAWDWAGKSAPEPVSWSVLKALQGHPDRAELVAAKPKMSKAEALAEMRKYSRKKDQQENENEDEHEHEQEEENEDEQEEENEDEQEEENEDEQEEENDEDQDRDNTSGEGDEDSDFDGGNSDADADDDDAEEDDAGGEDDEDAGSDEGDADQGDEEDRRGANTLRWFKQPLEIANLAEDFEDGYPDDPRVVRKYADKMTLPNVEASIEALLRVAERLRKDLGEEAAPEQVH